jgi:hypothetical protein
LLVFVVFAQAYRWLIVGAIALALTYSGAAAVHAITLAAIAKGE